MEATASKLPRCIYVHVDRWDTLWEEGPPILPLQEVEPPKNIGLGTSRKPDEVMWLSSHREQLE